MGNGNCIGNFEQGSKGKRPNGHKTKKAKGENFVKTIMTITEALHNVSTSFFARKNYNCRRFGFRARGQGA